MIPQSAIEEVKARNDIVDVVSAYVQLGKRSGQNIFGLCPFHREKTPSFSVSPGKQMYYCFGCHKGGDVIGFLMEIEKLNYVEAIRRLAERIGYDLPEDNDPYEREREQKRKRLFELNTEAARYYYQCLQKPAGTACRSYLEERGLSVAVQRQFGLGFAPDEWQGLEQHLLRKGYIPDELDRSGLFKINRNGGRYDLFRGRLMFPIIDALGRIIAFGGRVLDDSMPKYINSPETEIYTKGRHLFALNLAKKTRAEQFIIVEGYMDAIALHQAGLDQAVAILGTALTPAQAQLAGRYKETMILALDGDAAGQTATLRSLETLREKGVKASVLLTPDAKDPDLYIQQNGPERFRALLKDALSEVDYRLHLARQESLNDDQTLDALKYQELAVEILAQIDNSIVQELYLSRVAEEIGTTLDAVRLEMNRNTQRQQGGRSSGYGHSPAYTQNQFPPPAQYDPPQDYGAPLPQDEDYSESSLPHIPRTQLSRDQLYFIVILAQRPEHYAEFKEHLKLDWFDEGPTREFAEAVLDSAEDDELSMTSLLFLADQYRQDEMNLKDHIVNLSMRLPEPRSADQVNRSLRALLYQIEIRHLRNHRQQIAREMNRKDLDEETMARLRKEYTSCSQELTAVQQAETAHLN